MLEQGEEPEKEVALAASVKKQPEPVKAAATEVSAASNFLLLLPLAPDECLIR